MAHDFDDIVWMGHTCHSAVFAPLAVAEKEGSGARDLVTAVVAANEIGGRLGASSFLGPLNGQMITHIHLVGAAAATAKLLGLDEEKTTHALAISLAAPSFPLVPAFVAPTSKLLCAATPTATGIQAAYFARAGMTGAKDLLADRRGFWRRFSFAPLPFMLGDLGSLWVLRTLSMKTYPGCHYFQTACSAIDEILARTGPLAPEEIQRVRVETAKVGLEVDRFGRSYDDGGTITAVNVNFQLAVTAAVHLLAGRFTTDEMDPAWLAAHSDAIRALTRRIEVRHDPGLTAEVLTSARAVGAGRRTLSSLGVREIVHLARRYREEYASSLVDGGEPGGWWRLVKRFLAKETPATGPAIGLRFPNRVVVELRSGRREEAELLLPVGSLAAPGAREAVERKFLHETRRTLGDERARAALASAWALEETTVPQFVRASAA
jgi:2-methylcitrate dehydratase PrpD